MTSVMLPSAEKRPRAGKGKEPAYDPRMPPPPVPGKVQPAPAPLTPESISRPRPRARRRLSYPWWTRRLRLRPRPRMLRASYICSRLWIRAADLEGEDFAMDVSNDAGPSNMDLDYGFMNSMNSNPLELMTWNRVDWLQQQALDDAFIGANANATGEPGVYELAPVQMAELNVFPPPGANLEIGVMTGPLRTAAPEEVSVFAELLDGLDWTNMPGGSGDGMDMDIGFDANPMQEQPRSVTQNDLLQQFFNLNQLADGDDDSQDGDPSTSSAQLQTAVTAAPAPVPARSTPPPTSAPSGTGYTRRPGQPTSQNGA
ncbi:uncharacterized protein B0H18DRAFT_1211668 [Fomitopsis serialis]|uniref:uncharacterized protein n=1 Tax=Fomitopsis serialis TaxID=139415 RepID=UPI0020077E6E|nr:uncharacterized protein B0H18DRAFT_1211668 [Neoantrodia serialis]KAH9924919.1 hypothetical protein B0H18DRAFT_1211668 [Neoantrodia serialis]